MIRRSSPPSVSSQRLVLQSSVVKVPLCFDVLLLFFLCRKLHCSFPPQCSNKTNKKKRCVKFRVSNEDVLLLCFLFSSFFGDKIRDEDATTFEREREREKDDRRQKRFAANDAKEGRKAPPGGGKGLFFFSSSPGSSSSEEEESTRIYISLVVLECD